MTCTSCRAEFEGRAHQARYCSTACRRDHEYRRRRWDRRARAVRWAEQNALDADRTPAQQAYWLDDARALRAKLGPRP